MGKKTMFETAAATATAAAPAPKKKTKKKERTIVNVEGVRAVAALDLVLRDIGERKAAIESILKDTVLKLAVETADGRPGGILAVEKGASAVIDIKKRSASRILTDEEIAILDRKGIPYGQKVVREETFAINPKYAKDARLLRKVSALLEDHVPADFFVYQEREEAYVVTDETVEEAFKIGDIDVVKTVTTVAMTKPTLENDPGRVAEIIFDTGARCFGDVLRDD